MEFAAYVAIVVGSLSMLISIPCIIWGIHDNKRREREEAEAAQLAVTQ